MLKKKELEFTINNNILEVEDFAWFIDKINTIYISRSQTYDYKNCYAIYIQTNNETVRLYYLTKDIKSILKQFRLLCSALNSVKPEFKMYEAICFNFANAKNFEHFYVKDSFKESSRNFEYEAVVTAISKGGMVVNFRVSKEDLQDIKANLQQDNETSVAQ